MGLLSGAYFDVNLISNAGTLLGNFMRVEGLGMEMDYEVYNEGGSNYPRYFLKGAKPTQLVLSQGVITSAGDFASIMMLTSNSGVDVSLAGTITLYDSYNSVQRIWSVVGAHIVKYLGPTLDSNQPNLAVSQIVLVHNGCY